MRVAIGADHGGFELKAVIAARLREAGYEVLDVGAREFVATDDYPDFSLALAQAVTDGRAERGILICGSGVGACIAAGKVPGVRASLIVDPYSAHQGVEHDDMNVLCLGARVIGPELAWDLVRTFLAARFTGEPRHERRLVKVQAIEGRYSRQRGEHDES